MVADPCTLIGIKLRRHDEQGYRENADGDEYAYHATEPSWVQNPHHLFIAHNVKLEGFECMCIQPQLEQAYQLSLYLRVPIRVSAPYMMRLQSQAFWVVWICSTATGRTIADYTMVSLQSNVKGFAYEPNRISLVAMKPQHDISDDFGIGRNHTNGNIIKCMKQLEKYQLSA